MESSGRNCSGVSLDEQRAQFTGDVRSAFCILRGRGMDANQAVALALKVAAGVAELPPTPEELARQLRQDSSAPLGQLCSQVARFFANGDCLQAAFWPREMAAPAPAPGTSPPASSSSPAATQVPCDGSSARSNSTNACCTSNTAAACSSSTSSSSAAAAHGNPANSTTINTTATASNGPSTGSSCNSSKSSSKSGTCFQACPLDFKAIAALYDSVLGCCGSSGNGAEASAGNGGGDGTGCTASGAVQTSTATATAAGASNEDLAPSSPPSSSSSDVSYSDTSQGASPSNTAAVAPSNAAGSVAELSPPQRPAGHLNALISALSAGVEGLLVGLSNLPYSVNPGLARQLGVLLANPLLDRGEHHDLLGALVGFIGALSAPQRRSLRELFATYPAEELRRLLSRLHSFISLTLFRMQSITRGVEDATRLVALIHEANEEAGKRAAAAAAEAAAAAGTALLVPPSSSTATAAASSSEAFLLGLPASYGAYGNGGFGFGAAGLGFGGGSGGSSACRAGGAAGWRPLEPAAFYNDAINHEDFNLKEDFRKWKHPHKYDFCFCKFPFMYDPGSKARILQMENQMSQVNELHSALFRGLFGGGSPLSGLMPDVCPFLVLRVRRGPYLVQDTLIQIHRAKETDSLKKPLKVKFIGEEGVDEGGVAKEFFQLLVRQLFNPDYGMFTADPTSHLHWFRPSRLEMELEFELVGILIGLAIYNSHILEFQFPSVLYKKLMGATVGSVGGPGSAADTAGVAGLAAAAAAGVSSGGGGAAGEGADEGAGAEPRQAAVAAARVDVPRRGSSNSGEGDGVASVFGGMEGSGGSYNGAGGGIVRQFGEAGIGGGGGGEGDGSGGADGGGSSGLVLGLEDLRELAPEVSSSMAQLLLMPPDLVEQLGLVFQVDMEMGFGEVEAVELVPGGGELPVTAANRRLYVDLYVRHLLQDSIAPQFSPFRRGFLRLCSGSALSWFSPAELELLVCGSRQLRLEELEGATQYDDGYTRDSEPVRWFWEVAHALPPASQKRLLFFVTGSDRVPIKGLAHLNPPFVISRQAIRMSQLAATPACQRNTWTPCQTSHRRRSPTTVIMVDILLLFHCCSLFCEELLLAPVVQAL
ncbi:hypothetical protein Agub_g6465 [Astrephomene gubernaculifera]|uniref:HECT-type E3 ubiquitin transferase n=1 Tax=Astrephomene gubernaculifera TaxID=47775 RepID=A0AAD3DNE1_9CHLO|nr:hypothetical protein Agub_g6465 [Astrephomene gubernaculifera]